MRRQRVVSHKYGVTLVTFAALTFGDKARQRVRREWAFRVSPSTGV